MYGDEQVISEYVKEQTKQAHTIQREVEIGGMNYIFAERELPPCFSITVPTCFETMKEALVRKKFPSENRPAMILTNPDTTVNLTFSICERSDKSLKDLLDACQLAAKRLFPANVFFRKLMYDNPIPIGTFDYRSPALDMDIYNLWFYIDMPDGLLIGLFLCPDEFRTEWEPLAREMIQSVRLLPLEQEQ